VNSWQSIKKGDNYDKALKLEKLQEVDNCLQILFPDMPSRNMFGDAIFDTDDIIDISKEENIAEGKENEQKEKEKKR